MPRCPRTANCLSIVPSAAFLHSGVSDPLAHLKLACASLFEERLPCAVGPACSRASPVVLPPYTKLLNWATVTGLGASSSPGTVSGPDRPSSQHQLKPRSVAGSVPMDTYTDEGWARGQVIEGSSYLAQDRDAAATCYTNAVKHIHGCQPDSPCAGSGLPCFEAKPIDLPRRQARARSPQEPSQIRRWAGAAA